MAASAGNSGFGRAKNNITVHIGADRYKKLNEISLELSVEAQEQIAPSRFNKYLIDNFSEQAKALLREEIKKNKSSAKE